MVKCFLLSKPYFKQSQSHKCCENVDLQKQGITVPNTVLNTHLSRASYGKYIHICMYVCMYISESMVVLSV